MLGLCLIALSFSTPTRLLYINAFTIQRIDSYTWSNYGAKIEQIGDGEDSTVYVRETPAEILEQIKTKCKG